jgi:3-oxoacyl-[acyl-carrier-protein] synthase II
MAREVWITGIGLTSSLGEGTDAHWQAMALADPPRPVVDATSFAPYPIHPMVPLDFEKQIPKGGDRRQMENWQRVGTYTAGLALDDAGITGNMDILANTNMVVAAAGGERDLMVDQAVLEGVGKAPEPAEFIN